MLASIFVVQGYETLLRPERVVPAAEPLVRRVADRVPFVPADPESAVRLNGGIQLVAGTLLAVGRMPRLSALALAATVVPTTLAGHRFWEVEDDKERAGQRVHFLKNLSLLGGLLIAAADTRGRPSLAWRSRHAAHTVRRDVAIGKRAAKVSFALSAPAHRVGAAPRALAHRVGDLVPSH